MMDANAVIEKKVEEIKKLLSEGKRVFWGDVEIHNIEIVKTRRGFAILLNGELIYPSRFILRRILVV